MPSTPPSPQLGPKHILISSSIISPFPCTPFPIQNHKIVTLFSVYFSAPLLSRHNEGRRAFPMNSPILKDILDISCTNYIAVHDDCSCTSSPLLMLAHQEPPNPPQSNYRIWAQMRPVQECQLFPNTSPPRAPILADPTQSQPDFYMLAAANWHSGLNEMVVVVVRTHTAGVVLRNHHYSVGPPCHCCKLLEKNKNRYFLRRDHILL